MMDSKCKRKMEVEEQTQVNQVLIAEIIFWAVPIVNLCDWETLFSALNWSMGLSV